MKTHQEVADEYIEGFFNFLHWADGFLLLALILIIADLYFGVKAAVTRGDEVRRSKAVRRSMDKICAYIVWLLVAYSFGLVFGELFGIVSLPTILIFVIYVIEAESIYKNYLEWRGIKAKINLLKFFSSKSNIIEIEEKDNNKHPKQTTKKDQENEK